MILHDQQWPKITIVTPSYNQGLFLEETIRSVLGQNYPDLEYIIIDGGSTDNSVEVIKRYESKLAYWTSKRDNGQYDAINRGFSRATGEIFAWLNSDDIYYPWTLWTVGAIFREYDHINWISTLISGTCDAEGFCVGMDRVPGFSRESFLDGAHLPLGPNFRAWIQQESTFWRKSLWDKAGGLSDKYLLAGDFDLWSRFYRLSQLYGVESPLAAFRVHSSQKSSDQTSYVLEAEESLKLLRSQTDWSDNKIRDLIRRYKVNKIPIVKSYFIDHFGYYGKKVYRERAGDKNYHWKVANYFFL